MPVEDFTRVLFYQLKFSGYHVIYLYVIYFIQIKIYKLCIFILNLLRYKYYFLYSSLSHRRQYKYLYMQDVGFEIAFPREAITLLERNENLQLPAEID